MQKKYMVCNIKLLGEYVDRIINTEYEASSYKEYENVGTVKVSGLSRSQHEEIKKFISKRDIWLY